MKTFRQNPMPRRLLRAAAVVLLSVLLAACMRAGADAPPAVQAAAGGSVDSGAGHPALRAEQELDWLQMLPADELQALENGDVPEVDHRGNKAMPQYGTFRTVPEVLDRPVRLPGYVVPLENDAQGQLRSFLFVPYYGACIHVPPPPPNQIVYVQLDKAIAMPDMYSALYLSGTLVAEHFDDALAGSAYRMQSASLKPYEN